MFAPMLSSTPAAASELCHADAAAGGLQVARDHAEHPMRATLTPRLARIRITINRKLLSRRFRSHELRHRGTKMF